MEKKIPSSKPLELTPEEMSLSQSILKRREWGKKYGLSEAKLFSLFSEFTGIMMIVKSEASN
jgi:hypothetical protein